MFLLATDVPIGYGDVSLHGDVVNRGGAARDRALVIGLLATFGLTLARGWQWPNDWAEAQWLFTYEFGFMKRAMPGALLSPLLALAKTESQALAILRAATTVVLVLFCGALFYLALRVHRRAPSESTGALLALVFLSSPFVVMSAHTNGYLDQITVLLSALSGALVLRGRPWLAAALLAGGVLVHEAVLLVGLPSVIFIALARALADPEAGFRHGFRAALPLVALPLIALALIAANQLLIVEAAELERQLTERIGAYGFVERGRHVIVPRAYTTSLAAFFEQERPHFVGRIFGFRLALRAVPAVAVMSALAWSSIRARFPVARALVLQLAFLGVALVPLSLHAVAWDTSRIWTYPTVTAFLALWGLCELEPHKRAKPHSWSLVALALVAAFHVLIHTRLMDYEADLLPFGWRIALFAVPFATVARWAASRSAEATR